MSTTKKRTAKQIARMHEEGNAFEAYLARLRVGNRVSFDWEPEPRVVATLSSTRVAS